MRLTYLTEGDAAQYNLSIGVNQLGTNIECVLSLSHPSKSRQQSKLYTTLALPTLLSF